MSFESKHPVTQLIIDVAISLALFVVACVLAGLMQRFVTSKLEWMYTFWFAIGMLPCLFYMRHRAVAEFDNWDVVAFSPMPLVMGIASTFIDHQFVIFAIIPFVSICLWIRRFLPIRKTIESNSGQPPTDGSSASGTIAV